MHWFKLFSFTQNLQNLGKTTESYSKSDDLKYKLHFSRISLSLIKYVVGKQARKVSIRNGSFDDRTLKLQLPLKQLGFMLVDFQKELPKSFN